MLSGTLETRLRSRKVGFSESWDVQRRQTAGILLRLDVTFDSKKTPGTPALLHPWTAGPGEVAGNAFAEEAVPNR